MILKILEKGSTKVYAPDDQVADYLFLGFTDTGTTTEVVVTDPSKEIVEMKIEDDIVTAFRYKGDSVWRTVAGGGGGTDTYKVKVDGTDTADYLENKLQQGTNVTITKSGGKLVVNSTGGSGGAGVTVYADLIALKAVDTTSITTTQIVQVTGVGQYVFLPSSVETADNVRIVAPATGSGRWKLQASTDTAVVKQTVTFSESFSSMGGNTTPANEIIERGISRLTKTIPFSKVTNQISKVVVGMGDSNMAGFGLADKSNSYFNLLKTYLETNKGYTCNNMAVSGNTTTNMLARFYKDVLPLKPDLVVICPSFTNDGLYNQTSDYMSQYVISSEKRNIMTMINHLKTIGCDYIVVGGYPTMAPNTTYGTKTCIEMNNWFKKQFGDKYINIYNALTEADGTLSAIYDSGDNTHFNIAGHLDIYKTIKKNWIEVGLENQNIKVMKNSKGVKLPADTSTPNAFSMNYMFLPAAEQDTVPSFSTIFEVIPTTDLLTKILGEVVGSTGSDYINIELNASGNLILNASGSTILTTTTTLIPNAINILGLSYCSGTKKFSLYLNGSLVGTSTALATGMLFAAGNSHTSGKVYLGSAFPASKNCSGYTFRNFAFYRCSLHELEMADYYKTGDIPTSSLLYFNPFDGVNAIGYSNYGTESAWFRTANGYTLTDGTYYYTDYSTTEKQKLAVINTIGAAAASATTIVAPSTIFHVTGTTAISTITVPYTGFTGQITIIPDGIFTFTTGGNIYEAYTAVVGRAIQLVFDGTAWYRA